MVQIRRSSMIDSRIRKALFRSRAALASFQIPSRTTTVSRGLEFSLRYLTRATLLNSYTFLRESCGKQEQAYEYSH